MADKQKVIAVTVIHRTLEPGKPADKANGVSATRPKIQVIKPKTVFMTRDQDEFDDLMEAGAIRLPEKGEKVAVDIENVVAEDDATTTKTSSKATSSGKSGKATKGTESGTTKTSANAGTTTSGSQAGEGGDGDGNDLV